MQRALDDLALEAMVEIDKVFAVARDADDKIPMLVRMHLCIQQILGILIVDLDLRAHLLQIDLQHPDCRLRALTILDKGRADLEVQRMRSGDILVRKLQDGVQQRRRTLGVCTLRRADTIGDRFARRAAVRRCAEALAGKL